MRKYNKILPKLLLLGACLVTAAFPGEVLAAAVGSLSSITEEAQILPIPDGSGKYLLKSDGFYCLNADGTRENTPAVHYFDSFVIDGTVFDGYYYHDADGKFKAGSPYMVKISNLTAPASGSEAQEEESITFNGYYMVNNLGKLTAAPQIRYMDNLVMDGITFNGYYYFNEFGQMVTEPGIHYIEMDSNGQHFEGSYYFSGPNGVLVQEASATPEGFPVDETGKVGDLEDLGIDSLEERLETVLSGYAGEWSVYVKDLDTGESFAINNKPLYSASLIKAFVMAKTYADMEDVRAHEAALLNTAADNASVTGRVGDLLTNMITVSDNESFNELVRLQSEKHDFLDGAGELNKYLEAEGYSDTSVQHTLHPASSAAVGLGENNTTSVQDCGKLLERIYRGECVNAEASQAMLDLLLDQQVTWKIPQGLDEEIEVANKTGETDYDQHDIAIVYGEKTTYILCVMSEDWPDQNAAINNIRDISTMVYNYLNLYE